MRVFWTARITFLGELFDFRSKLKPLSGTSSRCSSRTCSSTASFNLAFEICLYLLAFDFQWAPLRFYSNELEPRSFSNSNELCILFQFPASSSSSFNSNRFHFGSQFPASFILVSNRFIYQPDAFSDLLSSCEATIVQSLICCSITIKLIQPSHRLSHLKILNRWEPPEAHLKLIEFSCAPWSKCCWPLTTSASRPIRYTQSTHVDDMPVKNTPVINMPVDS